MSQTSENTMPEVKVIIAGGREFTDYAVLKNVCDHMLSNVKDNSKLTIVSGGARGVDKMGERYAVEHGINLVVMNADWETHGKSAGYKRNQEMADVSTHLIAFWDGKSRGTKHMIDIAKRDGLKSHLVDFSGRRLSNNIK